ncbi:unnamed protein product [Schistosoma mattheei]|uniref:Uncharacterized protein n=1 Tax=Schistosoma mattheei TaxID=31246 RepID=A0A183P2S4_9TREM|nr:unnamed protein product [Schistosoma mattheei]
MRFGQTENPNPVHDYPNEYEADTYFPFDCFSGESSLAELHVLITHINAYLSVYSNMKSKRKMYRISCAGQIHMMECIKLHASVYAQILTYNNRSVRYEKLMQIGNVELAITL